MIKNKMAIDDTKKSEIKGPVIKKYGKEQIAI
jgi:hypothetical protein